MTSVTIPNSVISIGYGSFSGCSGLNSVTIPDGVTDLVEETFYGCTGLTSVTLGNGLTSIGASAFKNCSGLTDVYCLAENIPNTSSNAFTASPISSATLHVPAGSLEAYSTTDPWSDFGSIMPLTQDEIDDNEDIEHSPLNTEHSEVAIYNLAGRKIVNGQSSIVNAKWPQGINIIRYSDGTSRKVLIK